MSVNKSGTISALKVVEFECDIKHLDVSLKHAKKPLLTANQPKEGRVLLHPS